MDRTVAWSNWLLGRNRFAALALNDRDHGTGQGDAAAWANALVATAREATADGCAVWLLTQPRLFGFLFNPVSFWFFLDPQGALRATVAEVNNTFGQRHAYVCLPTEGGVIGETDSIAALKVLFVSPFQPPRGRYKFRFSLTDTNVSVTINYDDADGGGLFASISGPRRELTRARVLASIASFPLGSLRVAALIGWQALKLLTKRARYWRRPVAPNPNSAAGTRLSR